VGFICVLCLLKSEAVSKGALTENKTLRLLRLAFGWEVDPQRQLRVSAIFAVFSPWHLRNFTLG
jgi:hypothetical protein